LYVEICAARDQGVVGETEPKYRQSATSLLRRAEQLEVLIGKHHVAVLSADSLADADQPLKEQCCSDMDFLKPAQIFNRNLPASDGLRLEIERRFEALRASLRVPGHRQFAFQVGPLREVRIDQSPKL
jgi:hypothetical protein